MDQSPRKSLRSRTIKSFGRLISRSSKDKSKITNEVSKIPDALSSSIFRETPLDVLKCIMDFLPSPSATVFALTCKGFKSELGYKCIWKKEFFSSIDEYDELLELLAIDLPSVVACSYCHRLYRMKKSEAEHTLCCRPRGGYEISSLFGTTHVKMFMKLYHEDPKCTKVLDMMCNTNPIIGTSEWQDNLVQMTYEKCRVVEGSLIHRRQWVWMSLEDVSVWALLSFEVFLSQAVKIRGAAPSESSSLYICPHIDLPRATFIHKFTYNGRCDECRTEFCLGNKQFKGRGFALFLTVWKAFGSEPENKVLKQNKPLERHSSMELFTDDEWPADGSNDQLLKLSSAFEGKDNYKCDSVLTPKYRYEMFMWQWKLWQFGREGLLRGEQPRYTRPKHPKRSALLRIQKYLGLIPCAVLHNSSPDSPLAITDSLR